MIKERLEGSPLLKATLAGVQTKVREVLDIKRFVLSTNNNPKQGIRAIFGDTDYPYGWCKFPQITLNRENNNLKNIGRRGSGYGMGTTEANASVKLNYYFPAKLTADCTVKFLQYDDALVFAQTMLIAAAADMLNFKLQLPTEEVHVNVKCDGDSIPLPFNDDIDEGSTPTSFEIQFQLSIDTKIGFTMDTAKINNQGAITLNTELDLGEDLNWGEGNDVQ